MDGTPLDPGFDTCPVYQPDSKWKKSRPKPPLPPPNRPPPAWAVAFFLFTFWPAVVLAVLIFFVALIALPWNLPTAMFAFWPVYLLAALPGLAHQAIELLGRTRRLRADKPRVLTARQWLRQRLDALGFAEVALVVPLDLRQRAADRYTSPGKALLVSMTLTYGSAAYASAARSLARLRLLDERRGLAVLPGLTNVAHHLYPLACGLLIGGALVDLSALRDAGLILLIATAVLQLAGTAFELVVTGHAIQQLRGDPQLEKEGAELAAYQVKRLAAAQLGYALCFTAVAVLALPVASAVLTHTPPPLAIHAFDTAAPLSGIGRWIVLLASLCCFVFAVLLQLWRYLPQLVSLPLLALAAAAACATPTLLVLTWEQPFTAAHPCALALGVAAAWPIVTALSFFCFLPIRVLASLRFREPDPHEKQEPRETRAARYEHELSSPTPVPTSPLPLTLLSELRFLSTRLLPLPLAYLTLRALW